jgi:hypothetical protein
MPDREKIINGLNCCSHTDGINCLHCPYDNDGENCTALMSMDVLELLKEQKAVEPEQVDVYGEDEWWGFVCVCPDCKTEWMTDKDATHFCPNCGRPVKWE